MTACFKDALSKISQIKEFRLPESSAMQQAIKIEHSGR
jgi:hypothetical protein